jgi:hypothetical protein
MEHSKANGPVRRATMGIPGNLYVPSSPNTQTSDFALNVFNQVRHHHMPGIFASRRFFKNFQRGYDV